MCLFSQKKPELPGFIAKEDANLTKILEICDNMRDFSGFYTAQSMDANTDPHLVIDIMIPDPAGECVLSLAGGWEIRRLHSDRRGHQGI